MKLSSNLCSIVLACSFVECFDTSNRLTLFIKHHAQRQQKAMLPEPNAVKSGHTKNARPMRSRENKRKLCRKNCTARQCNSCLSSGTSAELAAVRVRCSALGAMHNCSGNKVNSTVMQKKFWNKYSLSYQGHSILTSLLN